jgi:hypothetical protein
MKTIYPISKCPQTGFDRQATIVGHEVSHQHKWASMKVHVSYHNQGKTVDLIPINKLQLVASNDDFVNPSTGEYVDKGTSGAMGEFDWFESQGEGLNLQLLYDRAIANATTKKRFDE